MFDASIIYKSTEYNKNNARAKKSGVSSKRPYNKSFVLFFMTHDTWLHETHLMRHYSTLFFSSVPFLVLVPRI